MTLTKKESAWQFYTFFLPLTIFVASSYFHTFQSFFDYLEIFATFLLVLGCMKKFCLFNKKNKILFLLLMGLFGTVFLSSRDITVIKFYLFFFSAYGINFRECVKWDLRVRITCYILVIMLNILGIIPSNNISRAGEVRYSLGFSHPNNLAAMTFLMLFELYYIKKFKYELSTLILTIISIVFLNIVTDSRTSELLIILTYILGTLVCNVRIQKQHKNIKSFLQFLIKNSYFIISAIIFLLYLCYRYNISIGLFADKLLSYRLYYIDAYYQKFNISFFGNNFVGFVSKKNPLDIGYAHILIRYGLVAFVLIGLAFKKMFKKLFEMNRKELIVIMISFIIYCVTENGMLRIEQNIFMILFLLIFPSQNNIYSLELKDATTV